jgi:hypothetical protein
MDAASVSLPAGRDWIASNKRNKSASASQVIPSKYFDRVFDRFRHLDQLKVFHRDASQAAEFFDPTHRLSTNVTSGPKLPPLTSTAKSRPESGRAVPLALLPRCTSLSR